MFTQREFLFLEDLMHMEELEAKKFYYLAHQTSDPEIRQLLSTLAQRHAGHFATVLNQVGQTHTGTQLQQFQPLQQQPQSNFQHSVPTQPHQIYTAPQQQSWASQPHQTWTTPTQQTVSTQQHQPWTSAQQQTWAAQPNQNWITPGYSGKMGVGISPTGVWSDKEILTDCLMSQKNLAHEYIEAVEHTDDASLMQTLMQICTDEQTARLQIYQVMNRRGLYNPTQANQQAVSQTIAKMGQTFQQLQAQITAPMGPTV